MHHASLYQDNAFLTLTLDAKHYEPSLNHRLWQLFMKKLRHRVPGTQLSFYMAGEYSPDKQRPHYHACLFNYNFPDRKYWRKTSAGSKLYLSDQLNEVWDNGFTSIGDVNWQSAAYIARYIVAKITGPGSDKFYERIDLDTGEIYNIKPEYNRMSLKTPIGKHWYGKYATDVYPEGTVLVKGQKIKAPKYYDKLYKRAQPENHAQLMKDREQLGRELRGDNTPQRLQAKERVKLAQVNQLLRKL